MLNLFHVKFLELGKVDLETGLLAVGAAAREVEVWTAEAQGSDGGGVLVLSAGLETAGEVEGEFSDGGGYPAVVELGGGTEGCVLGDE